MLTVAQMAEVTGFKTGEFLNLGKQLIAQIKIEDDNDASDCLIISGNGDESAPKKGDRIPVVSIGNFYISLGGADSVSPSVSAGEKLLYSRDGDGAVSAFIRFLSDGVLKINGEGDFLTRFNKLEEGFNQLKQDYNTHNHPTAPIGPVSLPSVISTASISQAKITELEVSNGN